MEPKTSRLDMRHGFVHHIRRNQIARDDYDREVREARGGQRQRRTPAPTRPRRPDQGVYRPPRHSGTESGSPDASIAGGGDASEDPSEEEEPEAAANGRAASPDWSPASANLRAELERTECRRDSTNQKPAPTEHMRDSTNQMPVSTEHRRDSTNQRPESNRRTASTNQKAAKPERRTVSTNHNPPLTEHGTAPANRKAGSDQKAASANRRSAPRERRRDSANQKPSVAVGGRGPAANQRSALKEGAAPSTNGTFRLEFEDDWGEVTSLIVNPGDDPSALASLLAERCHLDTSMETALRNRIASEMTHSSLGV